MAKSTVSQIRERFDTEVDRFSDLTRGHQAAVDSTLALDLITDAALALNPAAGSLLDIGCGGGNWTVKLLGKKLGLEVTLLDLAPAMLERAKERALAAGAARADVLEDDIRTARLERQYDIVIASAVLHHLRDADEWRRVFRSIYQVVAPGGSFWIYDLVDHELPAVAEQMRQSHGRHLVSVGGEAYRDEMFGNIEREDTPRPVTFQLDLLREVGFSHIDILHKNSRFAAFGAVKG
jgi:tRNA (cmo5U34)-methyltransferase